MKRMLAAVLPLALTGCGLPPAVAIVSYALDGITLFSTGKTVGDHALSVAAKQDCAVWRVVTEKDVCQEFAPGDVPALVAAAERWERDGKIVGMEEPGAVAAPAATGTGIAALDPMVVPAETLGAITGLERILQPDASLSGSPVAFAVRVDGPFGMAVRPAAEPAGPDATPEPPPAEVTAPPSWSSPKAPVMATPAAPVNAESAATTRAAAATTARKPQAAAKPPPVAKRRAVAGNVLVLGSFSNRSNAEKSVRKWRDLKPQVVSTKLGAAVHYRVVSMPLGAKAYAAQLRRLKAGGVKDAWGGKPCRGAIPARARCISLGSAAVN